MNNSSSHNSNEQFVVIEIDKSFKSKLFTKSSHATICLCFKGEIELLIDLSPFTIRANEQLIIMPNSIIKIQKVSQDISMAALEIKDSLFRDVCTHISPYFFRMVRATPLIELNGENRRVANSLICVLKDIYNDTNNLYRQQITRSIINAYILYTYNRYRKEYDKLGDVPETPRNKIFDNFIDLIHKNCSTQREVTFYADKLCISNKYLSDICHSTVGVSAKKIIDNFAILEIKVLLHNPQLSMQDIANQMAFPDQSYLGRYFKRFAGISPSGFRKQVINEMGG